jgi:hypothetical protein
MEECAPMPNLPEAEQINPEPTIAGFVYHPGLERIIVPRTDDGAVFTYDDDANVWEELSPAGGRFLDRYGVGMVFDAESDLVVAFGGAEWGRIEDGKHFSDRVIVFGGADVFGGEVMGDTWAYDTNTNTWEEMTPAVSPPARAGHAMWYDPVADLVFVFGGSRDWTSWPYLPWDVFGGEELWAYDFESNTWTLMRTQLSPGFVVDLAAAFDEGGGGGRCLVRRAAAVPLGARGPVGLPAFGVGGNEARRSSSVPAWIAPASREELTQEGGRMRRIPPDPPRSCVRGHRNRRSADARRRGEGRVPPNPPPLVVPTRL